MGETWSAMTASASQPVRYRMVPTKDDEIETEVSGVQPDESDSGEARSTVWTILDRKR